jgi:hypothetical protein
MLDPARPRLQTRAPLDTDSQARKYLLYGCLVTLALWFIPFASVVTYPLRIFVTFLHECGHAVAALITGGSVQSISVYPDTSGLTFTRGGLGFLVSSAGYVGTTVAAAALVLALRWLPSRLVLGGLGGSLALITLLWVRNPFGLAAGVVLAVALLGGARYLSPRNAQLAVAFLAVQSGMNALFDLRTILLLARSGHQHNDAAFLASATGVPAVVWAVLWAAMSVAILWVAIRTGYGGGAAGSRNLK